MRRTSTWLWLALGACACGGVGTAGEARDPEVVLLEAELGNGLVSAEATTEVVTRLRVRTTALQNAPRPPINLALVVDTSGSMEGAPIADARAASLSLLDTLRPEDRLAVIAFHSETEVLLESTRLEGADLGELRTRIGRMQARGTTDLGGGLRAGLEEVVRHFEPEGINRLVLLSDGVPNDASPVLPLAQAAGERGIRITALGLGLDFDETLLAHVAQRSGGRFHFVEESSMVAGVFANEVLRFERLLARNLQMELRPGPGVHIDGVVGQQITPLSNGHVMVTLGDLSEGEERDVIVRMQASPRRPGAAVELLDAVLRFEDAVANAGRLERRAYLGARASADDAEIEASRNRDVESAAARMLAAATTISAIEVAREGDIEAARRALALAEARARAEAEARSDDALRAQADQMRSLSRALPAMSAAPSPSYDAESSEAPSPRPPAAVIRSAHGDAMEVLQGR